ncbi:MAG TPA: hypothetical protein VJ461_02420 [Candidatus Nanoarchaeia archaeon]|nr:hypothetical protein [Candidatus Nanoarchaeia archaeon]
MSLDEFFEVTEEGRITFIEKNILGKLPEDIRESVKPRVLKIVNDYVGRDGDALSVLAYAAERGRFEEFAKKLEENYKENLCYVHPEARRILELGGAFRTEQFILDCYKEMDIKPQQK